MKEIKVISQVLDKNGEGGEYGIYNGDSCEVLKGLPNNSIDYSIFSPPFVDLYTYSDSIRDLGNCRNKTEFYEQFEIIIKELFRVIKNGRLVSIHCMDLPTAKYKDGFIGLTDFPGLIIKMFQDAGFIYHSRVTIWKNPVVAMQRTKSIRLLHRQIKKDSSLSGNGIADYLVTFRKPGENEEPISHTDMTYPVELWQKVAEPIWNTEDTDEDISLRYQEGCWFDINQSKTLQKDSAREQKDEKHICPLQLDVIEKAIHLWTNPNDVVLTPFMGIGSECYQALKMNRRAIGIELKQSYFRQAQLNLENINKSKKKGLF